MNRLVIPAAAAALAIASGGCGSNDDKAATASAPATATTSSAALPSELAGSYTRFVSKADIERTKAKRSEAGPRQSKPKPERALLFFEPAGMTFRNPDASFLVQADYSATDAGALDIRGYQHPDVGSFCGPEIAQNATYTWKTSGADKLVLHAVKDQCADRDTALTGVWTRK